MKKLILIALMASAMAEETNQVNQVTNLLTLTTNAVPLDILSLAVKPVKARFDFENRTYNVWPVTNLSTNWVNFEPSPGGMGFVKQLGTIQTNRALHIECDLWTNFVILEAIGRQEWPTQVRYANPQVR